ncbi:MAG TPA: ADOP family duplicated permease [Candidatus Acidoferrales bacterium]|nr:ADOP family duplicated permease [Candidatus Acidoferrales bacterium]
MNATSQSGPPVNVASTSKMPGVPFLPAARALFRNPGFSLTVLLVLALGIGTVSALFSVVNKILLEPLPYPDPDRLVQLITKERISDQWLASIPKYLLWRNAAPEFETMAAYDVKTPEMLVALGGTHVSLKTARVSAAYFELFGAGFAFGRTFSSSEDNPGGANVVVISDALSRRVFRQVSAVSGDWIYLNNSPYKIIGVLAPGVHLDTDADVWLPLRADPHSDDRLARVRVVARLRRDDSLRGTEFEMNKRIQREAWDFTVHNFGELGYATLLPLRDAVVGDVRPSLNMLMGAAAFVLSISTLNVATLFLARSSRRKREFAVRMALGAAPNQIALALLSEAVLLAIFGGLAGLLLGNLGIHELFSLSPDQLPRIGANGSSITLDARLFLFALLLATSVAILCAVIPAWNASRTEINVLVQDNTSRSGMTLRRDGWRSALVIAEMSFALVLLVGAGLLMRTFVAQRALNRGFDERNVVTFEMSLNSPRFDKTVEVARLVDYAQSRIESLPGVASVAAASTLPLVASVPIPFRIFEHNILGGHFDGAATWRSVSPQSFDVFQIQLLRGRMFTSDDDALHAPVVLINRAMMSRYWQQLGANPIGDYLGIGDGLEPRPGDPPRQIIGVVAEVRDAGLDREPAMYVPISQVTDWMTARSNQLLPLVWAVRLREDAPSPSAQIQNQLSDLSGGQPLGRPTTMHEVVAASSARAEFYVTVLAAFSAIALLLTSVGLYGLMAFSVEQRRRELAIRSALGATPLDVQSMVVLQALRLTFFGALAGIPLALALSQIVISLVRGARPWDPLMLAVVSLGLCAVSLAAAFVPSLRASRVDPAIALRSDS